MREEFILQVIIAILNVCFFAFVMLKLRAYEQQLSWLRSQIEAIGRNAEKVTILMVTGPTETKGGTISWSARGWVGESGNSINYTNGAGAGTILVAPEDHLPAEKGGKSGTLYFVED